MKKLLSVLFSIFVFFTVSCSLEFKVIKRNVEYGNAFLIKLKKSKIFKYEVFFDKRKYPLYEYKENYITFIPIPVEGIKDNILVIKKKILGIRVKKLRKEISIKKRKIRIYHLTKKDENIRLKGPIIKKENQVLIKNLFSLSMYDKFNKDFIVPIKGIITTEFGVKRKGKNFSYFHKGVDIFRKKGTKIKSAGDGIVAFVGKRFNVYGNLIVIDHGLGVKSCYFHLNKVFKKKGNIVKKGEVIAEVGDTGWATGPHLHFGIYLNGIPVDPFWFISFLKEIKF